MSDLKWNKEFALEQAADDEELLQELVQIFQEASASDLAKLIQGLEKEDSGQAGGAAHSIKGAAASLGIEGIRDVAFLIEEDCREGSLSVAKEQLPELEDLLKELLKL